MVVSITFTDSPFAYLYAGFSGVCVWRVGGRVLAESVSKIHVEVYLREKIFLKSKFVKVYGHEV